MRSYNIHGNRKACSRDIATKFAIIEQVRFLCSGRSGDAAASRYNSSVHEDFYFVIMEPYVYACMY